MACCSICRNEAVIKKAKVGFNFREEQVFCEQCDRIFKHKCDHCPQKFASIATFREHSLKKHKIRLPSATGSENATPDIIPCTKCKKLFLAKKDLEDHVDKEHANKQNECEESNENKDENEDSDASETNGLDEDAEDNIVLNFSDEDSDSEVSDDDEVSSEDNADDKENQPPLTASSSTSEDGVAKKRAPLTEVESCDKCGELFKTTAALKEHIASDHSSTISYRKYPCDLCDKSFILLPSLKMHKKKFHGVVVEDEPEISTPQSTGKIPQEITDVDDDDVPLAKRFKKRRS